MAIEKVKILGAVWELAAEQHRNLAHLPQKWANLAKLLPKPPILEV